MPRLQVSPFLTYYGKTNGVEEFPFSTPHPHRLGLKVKVILVVLLVYIVFLFFLKEKKRS